MTAGLGKFFPEDYRKQLAELNFKEGSVFKCHHPFAQKEKRFVLLAFKYDRSQIATVLFNSEINPYLFKTPSLKDLHLSFSLDNRSYLIKDCFLDCTQIFLLNTETFYDLLIADPTIHLGNLSDEDFKLLRQTIIKSHTIVRRVKKDFGVSM